MNQREIRRGWLTVLLVAPLAVACAPEPEAPTAPSPTARAGLSLTVDILADTDIGGFSYTATGVDCTTGAALAPPVVVQTTRDLDDLLIPGGNGNFANRPYDAASGHLFADAFMWLEPGCYDVVAQPITAAGDNSADCAPAARRNVPVNGGEVTEITLISQCRGEPGGGGLDVVATVNHPPQIDDVIYEPSKFTCEAQITVCVDVSDVDNDPLAATWRSRNRALRLVNETSEVIDGGARFCATYEIGAPGSYTVNVIVRDQGFDADGNLVPIEDLLAQQVGGGTSRVALNLPIHAMDAEACIGLCECPEGFEFNEAGDACVREQVVQANFNGELFAVCAGDQERNYGALGAMLPGGTVVTNDPFFGGDGTVPAAVDPGTRLNSIGVWGCEQGQPTDQWIGFSACVDLPEAGEYVVGIAGDDLVRLRVDGQQVYASNPGAGQANFRFWYLVPVNLAAGAHVIELEGWNDRGVAAFGAEIYGPYPVGSTASDVALQGLDYANNIVWSTGDRIGQNFDTGTTSGWSCEDGFALNACGEGEPVCVRVETLLCEDLEGGGEGGGQPGNGAGEENLPPAEPNNPRNP